MGENLKEQEKKAVVDVLNGVVGHEYYVYALCEKQFPLDGFFPAFGIRFTP